MILENEKILMLDTETTNSIDDPICYDVGFAVIDLQGNIYETHSYVIADVFLDEELMESAYFIDKVPQYWEEIKQGKRKLRRYRTVRSIIYQVCKKYDIKIVSAHNARFDNRSLNTTQRFLTSSKYRYFLPYGVQWWDTLKMARQILKKNEEYKKFCIDNNYVCKNHQLKFTAEVIYQFLTNNINFVESHTGLEDVLIEKEIFTFCIKQEPNINGSLWE